MEKLICHRGMHSEKVHENSYEAILKAFQNPKYEGVEFDVRETLDHEFVIYHNSMYNGKLISNTSFFELPRYIPKLKEILKIKTKKIFLVELKNITSFSKLYKLLNKYHYQNIYVMSFSNRLINKMNKNKRQYKIGILNYVLNTEENILNLDFICILNSLLNQKMIDTLSSLEIFSYGVIDISLKKKYSGVYYIVNDE